MLTIAMATLAYRMKIQRIIMLSFLAIVVIFMAIVWTAVKPEFRNFINEGTGKQVVTVPFKERAKKLSELSSEIDSGKFNEGVENLVKRMTGVYMFAHAIRYVPSSISHQNGPF